MAKSTLIVFIVVIAALLVVGLTYYISFKHSTGGAIVSNTYFTITDAATNMGSVSKVDLTIDKIEAHSETEGWILVSSEQKTYDLLKLKALGKEVLLTDVTLKEGNYDQVRLEVSKVIITDINGEHTAKLPSGVIKIVGGFNISSNSAAIVKFDFIADESLHMTGNDRYIFAPVVQYETRENPDIEIEFDNSLNADIVSASGGSVKTNIKVGTDKDGNVGVGLKIPSNANLTIGSDNVIKVNNDAGLSLG